VVVLPSLCLESDVCVDAIRGRVALANLAARHLPGALAWISSVTLAELEYGAALSGRRESHAALSRLLEGAKVRAFDERAAATYGGVRRRLGQSGQMIGALDMLIGAHALAEGAVLITRNVREFRRIEGLTVLDAGR
jgi:tRNA(fMet)-specific endonuclease VapC